MNWVAGSTILEIELKSDQQQSKSGKATGPDEIPALIVNTIFDSSHIHKECLLLTFVVLPKFWLIFEHVRGVATH